MKKSWRKNYPCSSKIIKRLTSERRTLSTNHTEEMWEKRSNNFLVWWFLVQNNLFIDEKPLPHNKGAQKPEVVEGEITYYLITAHHPSKTKVLFFVIVLKIKITHIVSFKTSIWHRSFHTFNLFLAFMGRRSYLETVFVSQKEKRFHFSISSRDHIIF